MIRKWDVIIVIQIAFDIECASLSVIKCILKFMFELHFSQLPGTEKQVQDNCLTKSIDGEEQWSASFERCQHLAVLAQDNLKD